MGTQDVTTKKPNTDLARHMLVCVLIVQLVFALTAAGVLILDPEGFLNRPKDQALATLLVLMPITIAVVLALRIRRHHRAEKVRTRAAAQLMDTMLSTSREWRWAVDNRWLFTFSSPASADILGWEPSELLGRPVDLIIEQEDLVRAATDIAQVGESGWAGVSVRCRHRDGHTVWMEVAGTVAPPTEGQRPGFAGTSRVLPPLTAREAVNALSRAKLQRMIAQNMLLTAFQPIRCLNTGRLLGVEALTRFVDEDGAGTEFWFNEAAMVGLSGELEFATLEQSLATAEGLPPDIHVALNISPATCLDPRLPGLLQQSSLPLKRIVLELTERLEVSEYDPLMSVLAPLRQGGLRIAVDDAGSGFASMRHVLHIRPDIIKLDRSLVAGIADNQGQHALGAAMVEFARKLGATLIAEGIETIEELTSVTDLGMEAGQGYLLGRPSIHPGDWAAWHQTRYPTRSADQP